MRLRKPAEPKNASQTPVGCPQLSGAVGPKPYPGNRYLDMGAFEDLLLGLDAAIGAQEIRVLKTNGVHPTNMVADLLRKDVEKLTEEEAVKLVAIYGNDLCNQNSVGKMIGNVHQENSRNKVLYLVEKYEGVACYIASRDSDLLSKPDVFDAVIRHRRALIYIIVSPSRGLDWLEAYRSGWVLIERDSFLELVSSDLELAMCFAEVSSFENIKAPEFYRHTRHSIATKLISELMEKYKEIAFYMADEKPDIFRASGAAASVVSAHKELARHLAVNNPNLFFSALPYYFRGDWHRANVEYNDWGSFLGSIIGSAILSDLEILKYVAINSSDRLALNWTFQAFLDGRIENMLIGRNYSEDDIGSRGLKRSAYRYSEVRERLDSLLQDVALYMVQNLDIEELGKTEGGINFLKIVCTRCREARDFLINEYPGTISQIKVSGTNLMFLAMRNQE